MMGDTKIRPETRERVKTLCAEAGMDDFSGELETEQAAELFMQELQQRMQQRAPDTI
jgi:hypothetical protein